MKEAILISIQPKWGELIASGHKTIEVRKTVPKLEAPFKCYIYMTATKERCKFWEYITAYQNEKGEILNGSQKVIGEFVCDRIETYHYGNMDYPTPAYDDDESVCTVGDGYYITSGELEETCLTYEELEKYGKGKSLYGWHISDLKIYDKPKELGEFRGHCGKSCLNCNYIKYLDKLCDENGTYKFNKPPQSWCYTELYK